VRVALVSPYDLGRFGGVQDQVLQLSGWLRAAGHEAVVLGPGHGPAGSVTLGPATVITVNGAAAPIRLDPRFGDIVAETAADCDVIHIHEPLMPMVGPVAARVKGPAVVGTFHADPSSVVRSIYRRSAPILRRLLRWFDALTAVSPVAAGAVAALANPTIVPNGLDVSSYRPRPGIAKRVAFLGRDDPRKGLDVLLEAWATVHREVPDAELVVAAGERNAAIAGVRFVGGVGEADKRTLLSDAAVFCAPNLGGESFGIILVEAMASQCAVVASALPAFTHVLADAGALVKPGDATGLAGTLVDLLRSPDAVAALQAQAVVRVQRYDRQAVLTGYLEVYERAIDRHSRRA
jgi:phosphatidylinositol alpha-mannosyltransferase